ncbi:MAG: hypothetical protein IPO85_17095 [Saprospiraceae bacterium]|uniref:Uncharacterized protein n=1 Tax=Candidatus Defluviibacterium haderslevense TaxID=2981993 RepID=A0A9D7SCM7_9BACT|nr:hypothetical protein [Candidatus Defluviibacterium haderslevense]
MNSYFKYDFVDDKIKPGAKLVNGELLIPIEDDTKPTQNNTTTPAKPAVRPAKGVPSYLK